MVMPSATPEVVVMIGFPGSGKTTGRRLLVAAMLREAGRRPGGPGQSVVFDSTGNTRERRARTQDLPVRFVWMSTPF